MEVKDKNIFVVFPLGNQVVLPDCKDLPEPGTAAAENCVRIGIPPPLQPNRR